MQVLRLHVVQKCSNFHTDLQLWRPQIIHNPAAYGVGLLILMLLVKAFLTSTSFATGFDGGPIFPLVFIGGTMGLAISHILMSIPEGAAVTAGMAGCCVPHFLNYYAPARISRGSTRSFTSNYNWGRYRFRDI